MGTSRDLSLHATGMLEVQAKATSRLPFDTLQLVQDGEIVAEQTARQRLSATLTAEIPVARSGWVAACVQSDTKTHAGYKVFAHTSPVFVEVAGTDARRGEAAGALIDELETSVRFIRKFYQFSSDADLAIALGRFEQARQFYVNLLREGTK